MKRVCRVVCERRSWATSKKKHVHASINVSHDSNLFSPCFSFTNTNQGTRPTISHQQQQQRNGASSKTNTNNGVLLKTSSITSSCNGSGTPKPLRAPPPIPTKDEEEEEEEGSSEYEYETDDDDDTDLGNKAATTTTTTATTTTTTTKGNKSYEEQAESILENEENPNLDYIDEDDEEEDALTAFVGSPMRKKKQTFISGTVDIDILLGKE